MAAMDLVPLCLVVKSGIILEQETSFNFTNEVIWLFEIIVLLLRKPVLSYQVRESSKLYYYNTGYKACRNVDITLIY